MVRDMKEPSRLQMMFAAVRLLKEEAKKKQIPDKARFIAGGALAIMRRIEETSCRGTSIGSCAIRQALALASKAVPPPKELAFSPTTFNKQPPDHPNPPDDLENQDPTPSR